jgi:hypothetical protein
MPAVEVIAKRKEQRRTAEILTNLAMHPSSGKKLA